MAESGLHRLEAVVDLLLGGRHAHAVEQRMAEAVISDGVALGAFASPHEFWVRRGVAADEEEGRTHTSRLSASSTAAVVAGLRCVEVGEHAAE
jgi:hypothetical protein